MKQDLDKLASFKDEAHTSHRKIRVSDIWPLYWRVYSLMLGGMIVTLLVTHAVIGKEISDALLLAMFTAVVAGAAAGTIRFLPQSSKKSKMK